MRFSIIRLVSILSLMLLDASPAFCWGFFGHRHINYHAVFLLPPQLLSFYKRHIRYLADHAVDADKRRYAIAAEGPRHYIDMDHYRLKDGERLPVDWKEAVGHYTEDTLQAHGIAPWWIVVMKHRLTQAFREGNVERILKSSADIGHYIADIHVPLHASSNHNGQQTNQHGIHGFWESRLPELFALKEYDLLNGSAVYLSNAAELVWQRVRESAAASDTVLSMEKQLSQALPTDVRFAYEIRNGVVGRQFSASYAQAYHHLLNGMVERRMRQSIHAVASFWLTAWIDAGQPRLPNGSWTPDASANSELDSLQAAWLKGNILGRSCSN